MSGDRHPSARRDLGHTEIIMVKLHPDLKAHIDRQAGANYCSTSEYVRRLIVADMRATEASA